MYAALLKRGAGLARPDPPFGPFFVLGTLDAIAGVAVWLPVLLGWPSLDIDAAAAAAWHARELLFGAFPAVISGFLLTALPRWTGRPVGPAQLPGLLALLWLAGPASLLLQPAARPAVAAGYAVVLAAIVGHHVLRTGSHRNYKLLPLLALLAGAAVIDALGISETPAAPFRLAIAAILGQVMVLGGRIIPSLTAAHLERSGGRTVPPAYRPLEIVAATAAAAALGTWVLAPATLPTGCLGAVAAVAQVARWLRWRPWQVTGFAPLLALHAAYACIPLGFALVASGMVVPGGMPTAALHVWTIGAIGLMSVAVMASMIRRHSGHPFASSGALNGAIALLVAALTLRVAADVMDSASGLPLLGAVGAWTGAQFLFLVGFCRQRLCEGNRSSAPRRRQPRGAGDGGAAR